MSATKIFLHGVPDTPAIWDPLRTALGDTDASMHFPAMPGFVDPTPSGFETTKDGYAEWFVELIRAEHERPMRVVGTGGLAPLFSQGEDLFDFLEDDLTMHGLTVIHKHNKDIGSI